MIEWWYAEANHQNYNQWSRLLNQYYYWLWFVQDFLEYIQEVGEVCGFEMTAEKLKIPSTKRVCLIGRRTHNDVTDDAISAFITAECPRGETAENSG